jgi:hypothetical protein
MSIQRQVPRQTVVELAPAIRWKMDRGQEIFELLHLLVREFVIRAL